MKGQKWERVSCHQIINSIKGIISVKAVHTYVLTQRSTRPDVSAVKCRHFGPDCIPSSVTDDPGDLQS